MNTPFMKIWLPISLAVHVVLIAACTIVPFGMPTVPGNRVVEVDFIQSAEAAQPKPEPEPQVIEEPRPERIIQPEVRTPVVETKPVQTREKGTQQKNPFIRTGNASQPGSGKKDLTIPDNGGVGKTAAPDVVSAKNGQGFNAPPGTKDGEGTGGSNEKGPSGPSYGAKAKYGLSGMSKAAGEINLDGDAIFTVELSSSGSVNSVRLANSTGNRELDDIAERLVRNYDGYEAAMKNGVHVADTVRMKVTFSKGHYSIGGV